MERNEVSMHEARLFRAMQKSGWQTVKELATKSEIARRTAHHHVTNFVKLGIADLAEVFPAHRYRLSDKATKRNQAYIFRLESACDVFGI